MMSRVSALLGRLRRTVRQVRFELARSRFVALRPEFDDIIDTSRQVKRVVGGFRFTEGPVWLSAQKCLLFSDIPANTIYRWSEDEGLTVFRNPSGKSNGLTLDADGRLVACEHGTRRVTRTEADGVIEVLAGSYGAKPLNSPNDVVVHSSGDVYFTDPPYGIDPSSQEQPVAGVYRVRFGLPEPELVLDDFERPNGLAFSPDESTLYVDDSSPVRRHIRVFDIDAAGRLTNGRIFCDMDIEAEGVPDGMKIDVLGNVFCTGPGGLWILSPRGDHLGTVQLPELPANCAWGDDDRQTLYVTARTGLYRLRTRTRGFGIHLG